MQKASKMDKNSAMKKIITVINVHLGVVVKMGFILRKNKKYK
jgi:hypothetical protein